MKRVPYKPRFAKRLGRGAVSGFPQNPFFFLSLFRFVFSPLYLLDPSLYLFVISTTEKNIDHRNLYLAKVRTSLSPHKSLEKKSKLAFTNTIPFRLSQEGQILEGTPAAEGESAKDMDRRRR